MKKTTLLIIGIVLVALVVITSYLFSLKSVNNNVKIIPSPTPIVELNPSTNLGIVTATPSDNAKNVPVNQIITVVFTANVPSDKIIFSMNPSVEYKVDIFNNELHVNFLSNLSANTTYTYIVGYKGTNFSHQFTFTTAGAETGSSNDNAADINRDWTRANDPGLFLYNYSPYDASTFSMSGELSQTEPYHYVFTVSLTGSDQNQDKQDFLDWLKSTGLTSDQIQTLDIQYQ